MFINGFNFICFVSLLRSLTLEDYLAVDWYTWLQNKKNN